MRIPMNTRTLLNKRAAGLLVFAMLAPARLAIGQANSPQTNSAIVDYVNKTLTLSGVNYGLTPVVTLGRVALVVQSSSSTQLVTTFPSALPLSSFTPGTYSVTVSFKGGQAT